MQIRQSSLVDGVGRILREWPADFLLERTTPLNGFYRGGPGSGSSGRCRSVSGSLFTSSMIFA